MMKGFWGSNPFQDTEPFKNLCSTSAPSDVRYKTRYKEAANKIIKAVALLSSRNTGHEKVEGAK